jgi:NADH-quinone oxidoreductase subunit C
MSDDDRSGSAAAIAARLHTLLPDLDPVLAPSADVPAIVVPRDRLVEVCEKLVDDPELDFALLVDVIGVDYLTRDPRYDLVYHVVSIERARRLRLKVPVPGADPQVPTVSGIWPAAGFLEREVWDLFGIVFEGHADLRRLLTPEDWEGHPLRKDYPVQVRVTPTAAEPLQITEEEFKANIEADRVRRQP